jgi:hypothetical protein
MNETVGNDVLNPSFSHNLRLMYSAFFDSTFASLSTMVQANLTKDALVSNRIYDPSNKQYSQTVNSPKMPLQLNWNIMYNTPLITKLLHFNTNTSLGYRTQYSYVSRNINLENIDLEHLILGDESRSISRSASEELSLTLTQDIIELGVRGNVQYSNSLNTLKIDTEGKMLPTEVWNWSIRGNAVLRLPYQFTISSDIAYSDRAGYTNMDQSEVMWNASIDKQLFKNRATLSLIANDILRQRLNIRQTIGDNYTSYNKYNTLPAYFLVRFTYQLRNFGGSSNRSNRGNYRSGGDMPAPSGDMPAPSSGGGMRGGGGGFQPQGGGI